VVAKLADLVGLSFCQSAQDVQALQAHLGQLQAQHLGIVLKIETQRAFEHLPEMLLAAMSGPVAGVMIARGDLAVECGYERMAEVQEEILWACEAAHMPVIWATQVLETLAKTGLPSRAEITDAAMGERAECVMLNKGPTSWMRFAHWTTSSCGCSPTSPRSARCCERSSPGARRTARRSRFARPAQRGAPRGGSARGCWRCRRGRRPPARRSP
jgi:hypothetical protein